MSHKARFIYEKHLLELAETATDPVSLATMSSAVVHFPTTAAFAFAQGGYIFPSETFYLVVLAIIVKHQLPDITSHALIPAGSLSLWRDSFLPGLSKGRFHSRKIMWIALDAERFCGLPWQWMSSSATLSLTTTVASSQERLFSCDLL